MVKKLCYLLICVGLMLSPVIADQLHIRVLDVGEGQSILLHTSDRAILVDTGHAGKAGSVLERMGSLGIQHLDYLILTHLHADHASGFFRIHEQYPQTKIVDNCYPVEAGKTDDMVRWVAEALEQSPGRRCVSSGDLIQWQGTEIAVLWPMGSLNPRSGLNHSSLVLRVSRGSQQLLIMGDADTKAEERILEHYSLQPVSILVVGHHGAKDASSKRLLQAVKPEHAVISINRDNFRGYPSAKVLERLTRFSGEIHTTYADQEIHFVFE